MSDRKKGSQGLRVLFATGVSVITLAVCVGRSTGETSEIDSYEAAVRSQSKAEALSFIRNFGSSHLVGDLIESLSPEVAEQVCADLQGGGPARTLKVCEVLREAIGVKPDVPAADMAPSAGSAVVDSVSIRGATTAGVSSDDELEGEPDAGGTDFSGIVAVGPASTNAINPASVPSDDEPLVKADGTDLFAVPAAGIAAVGSVSTSAITPSEDETPIDQDAGDTDDAGGTDLSTVPAAGIAAVEPVSTSAATPVSVPSDDERLVGQDVGDTDMAGDADPFYLLVASTAPAAGVAAGAPASTSAVTSVSVPSDDEPQGRQGTGDTDKSDGMNTFLQTVRTAPAGRSTAAPSESISASASTGVPSGDEPEINSDQSSDPSGSDQSSNGNKDNGKKSNGQSSSDQSSDQSSSDQSGKGKGDKGKGGKGKGGKGKGGKDKSSG